jgi:imidazolonepropionase
MNSYLFTGANEVVTGAAGATDGSVLRGAAVLVTDGRIAAVGRDAGAGTAGLATQVDCRGSIITPGFVDSHTHAVFGGWRAAEYALRSRGVPYMEIARRGGGINASVRDVRARGRRAHRADA